MTISERENTRRDDDDRRDHRGPKLLSYSDLREKGIKFSKQWIRKLIEAEQFPKIVKLGSGPTATAAFLESEIDDWIANKVKERDAVS